MNEETIIPQITIDRIKIQSITKTDELNYWIFRTVRPFIKGRILQINSSEGDISSHFVSEGIALRISDPEITNCQALKGRFSDQPLIKGVYQINLRDQLFEETYSKFHEQFDTILILSLQDFDSIDFRTITNAKTLLKERGRLFVLAPANTTLFEESDSILEDLIKFNTKHVKLKFGKEMDIITIHFVNSKFGLLMIPMSRKVTL